MYAQNPDVSKSLLPAIHDKADHQSTSFVVRVKLTKVEGNSRYHATITF
jgi:hypothetical protein